MGTPLSEPVVPVLSRASTASVQPTAVKPSLYSWMCGVAGCSSGLDPGVVGADAGRGGVALGGREEDQSEPVADSEPAGDEAPVVEYEGLAIIARLLGNLRFFRRHDDRCRHRH